MPLIQTFSLVGI